MLRKERKWSHIKISVKTTKGIFFWADQVGTNDSVVFIILVKMWYCRSLQVTPGSLAADKLMLWVKVFSYILFMWLFYLLAWSLPHCSTEESGGSCWHSGFSTGLYLLRYHSFEEWRTGENRDVFLLSIIKSKILLLNSIKGLHSVYSKVSSHYNSVLWLEVV